MHAQIEKIKNKKKNTKNDVKYTQVNNKDTRMMSLASLTLLTLNDIVNFEHISSFFIGILLLNLDK